MRVIARQVAVEVVFSSRFTGEVDANLASARIKAQNLDQNDREYLNKILDTIRTNEEFLISKIDNCSKAFPESRLYPADKSILLVALAEIYFFDDIPKIVSVNEAANLASMYSTEKSASFISGILSQLIKE